MSKQLSELKIKFRKYCEEFTKVMKLCAEVIQTNMLQEEYKVIPFSAYKDGSRAFSRMLDLCDRFVPANQHIISDHKNKTKAKKKTRRYVPT